MADVVACTYRFVRETGNDDQPYERVVLKPGDKASNLPKEVAADLKKQGLVVDEKALDKQQNRIPGVVVVRSDQEETVSTASTGSGAKTDTKKDDK